MAYASAAFCFSLAALAGAIAAAGATTNPVVSVSVRDFALVPNTLTVTRGTVVRFTNTGEALHRIVSDDGTLDTHPLQPGHNATFTFSTVGVFPLHCEIHPTMKMTVTVVASQPLAATDSGTTKSATQAAAPQTLAKTGAGTTMLSIFGLGLILLGMVCLAVGRSATSPIPAVAAAPSTAAALTRTMGWENRFDDLLPGRIRPRVQSSDR